MSNKNEVISVTNNEKNKFVDIVDFLHSITQSNGSKIIFDHFFSDGEEYNTRIMFVNTEKEIIDCIIKCTDGSRQRECDIDFTTKELKIMFSDECFKEDGHYIHVLGLDKEFGDKLVHTLKKILEQKFEVSTDSKHLTILKL